MRSRDEVLREFGADGVVYPVDTVDRMADRLRELEGDAKRWRWLRMQSWETFKQIGWSTWAVDQSVASRRDEQVDAALESQQAASEGASA